MSRIVFFTLRLYRRTVSIVDILWGRSYEMPVNRRLNECVNFIARRIMRSLICIGLLCLGFLVSCSSDDSSDPITQLPNNNNDTGTDIGQRATDFTLNDQDGNPITLSDFRGKTVLIEFWRTTCGECVAEMHFIEELWDEFRDRDFAIIGVSVDIDPDRWREFINAPGTNGLARDWTQVLNDDGESGNIVGLYDVAATPKRYLLNEDGVIVHNAMEVEAIMGLVQAELDN